jgi:AcrR family transcriptional regulator
MSATKLREERRARQRQSVRSDILEAARRVAMRDGARNLSLRGAAAEAGFAPAALYSYFRNKDELMLALAADDLSRIAQAMRAAANGNGDDPLAAAASAALALLARTETLAAASGALAPQSGSEMERLFNGRMIAALTALSNATGSRAQNRDEQADVVLLAAALAGIAMLERNGRLQALGFSATELLGRLRGFTQAAPQSGGN